MVDDVVADTPTTVVISTHQIYELESLADHVGVLSKGHLVAQISRDDLRRTVRRYFLDIPDDWTPPADLQMSGVRRAGRGVRKWPRALGMRKWPRALGMRRAGRAAQTLTAT